MRFVLLALTLALSSLAPQTPPAKTAWRLATPEELQSALPARARVLNERIETEARTASGIISQRGQLIAGIVLITAGYSADGKYSHYLMVQSPITVGDVAMSPGSYVLGWTRVHDGLDVHFYEAATGTELGTSIARELPSPGRVESFRIWPPAEGSIIQIGRFALPYKLHENP
jgi:hypothetical protein